MRWLISLLTFILMITPAAARGTLLWASDGEANVPYVFHDPASQSRMQGFEFDIMHEVGHRLNVTPKFVQNDWDGLIPGLQRGLYRLVVDGIEITPEHEDAVLFSRPYYETGERIVVRKGQSGLDTLDGLRGHVVGTIRGTYAERLLRDSSDIAIRTYMEETNAVSDLRNKRLDALLVDAPIAVYYGALSDDLKLVGKQIGTVHYGIAMRKGDYAMRDRVDRALSDMMADGTLQRILSRWNLWTPQMAAFTGDETEQNIAPVEWDRYRLAMADSGGWIDRLELYAGFLPLILHGAWLTLAVSAAAMLIAVALGVLLALMRHYGSSPLKFCAGIYIEVVRGTPLLIQILLIFYGLPRFGVNLSPFLAGVVALGLNYAAYEAENYRAGLLTVSQGQMEAAIALNMTRLDAVRLVIVPQAFRTVVPVMTNDFISLLKDSSLVSVITLTELSQTYIRLSSTYYDYFGIGLLIGGAYLLLGLPFVRLARYAEKRLGRFMLANHSHHH